MTAFLQIIKKMQYLHINQYQNLSIMHENYLDSAKVQNLIPPCMIAGKRISPIQGRIMQFLLIHGLYPDQSISFKKMEISIRFQGSYPPERRKGYEADIQESFDYCKDAGIEILSCKFHDNFYEIYFK